jgi:hypothetical protein
MHARFCFFYYIGGRGEKYENAILLLPPTTIIIKTIWKNKGAL